MLRDDTPEPTTELVHITHGPVTLAATLTIPARPRGVVLFAHDTGHTRYYPLHRFVAARLQEAGFATLLLDLLTQQESWLDERTQLLCFDARQLGERLVSATDWLASQPRTAGLAVGYFGTRAGAGAALVATAERSERARAVVSCAGRADLAGPSLAQSRAPTLLIVGEQDTTAQALTRRAMRQMRTEAMLALVAGAVPPFEEADAVRRLTQLTAMWFEHKLAVRATGAENRPSKTPSRPPPAMRASSAG